MRGHFAVGFQSREEGEEWRGQCVDTLLWASKVERRETRPLAIMPCVPFNLATPVRLVLL